VSFHKAELALTSLTIFLVNPSNSELEELGGLDQPLGLTIETAGVFRS